MNKKLYSHERRICSLMGDDDRAERGRPSDIPYGAVHMAGNPGRSRQCYNNSIIAEVHIQNWTESPSPPDAVGSKSAFCSQSAVKVGARALNITIQQQHITSTGHAAQDTHFHMTKLPSTRQDSILQPRSKYMASRTISACSRAC